MNGHVLVVDDEREMRNLLQADLELRGFTVTTAGTADEALVHLREQAFDVVLADVFMPAMNGVELCSRIVANSPDVPVVIMTAFGSVETAVQSLRANAFDFVTKPVDTELLALTLQRAVEHHQLSERVRLLSHPVDALGDFEDMLGNSPRMLELRQQILRIADTDASVLIVGESGTGKELVARELCKHSRRKDQPFVTVNCAALPHALLEAELFGHARGAFTDARNARRGLFVEANRGTLFLDEIGEIPLDLQPKLLRAIENRTIRPIGSNSETVVDVRMLAATNRELAEAVAAGDFREDLYYRINVVRLSLPPLRERDTDTLDLARHFLAMFADRHRKAVTSISQEAARRLLDYQWPGNVRELRNAIESAVVLTAHSQLSVEDLPETIREYRTIALTKDGDPPSRLVTLDELERRYILQVLQSVGGNKSQAAEILGLDRKTLYRRLQRYGEWSTS